ncbi:MAG TPA: S41 family peptidase [Anaerolineae bacterium]|nr:S41 family peptidase [Anaerolineae bacterium]HNU03855.1 S41 family peptidase [Anaerolineae bacterium]
MNQRKTSPLVWAVAALAIVLLGAMTFAAGFGAGFGTGRVTAPKVAVQAATAGALGASGDRIPLPGRPTPAPEPADPAPAVAVDTPEDFELIWEAWDALEESFYGDLPATPETVGGLVEGLLRAIEVETGEPLDREQAADAILAAALQIMQQQAGGELSVRDLTYGAINGLTLQLNDDYTYLRDPEEAAFFNETLEGSFEGIGARVAEAEGGGVRIVEPFSGQPAWNAGIRRGDVILAVDGQDITRMTLQDAISLIRGPKGSDVLLTVKSEGQESREIAVVRDRITVPAVEYRMLDEGVAYLRLGEFSAPATEQMREALKALQAQNPSGLVLDLRGNPGGFLRTAVEITSEFIDEGPVVIERFKDGREDVFEAQSGGSALTIPLVVLVDEGSASASEILAGAVQDAGRGILVGARTYGKGSVQIPDELSDGSVMSITTARWFTPNDRLIHGEGLLPDIEVPRSEEDIAADRDPQLERAVEYLLQGQ